MVDELVRRKFAFGVEKHWAEKTLLIEREIETEVDRKVNAVSRPAGVSAKTALVYDGELSPLVSSDGYFDALIPATWLLGRV